MRLTRRATRDQVTKPDNEHLPDGIQGTITGGPTGPIGLLEILERGSRGASRGGAVSGAAQGVADILGRGSLAARGISLSDGSRICFASIADTNLFRDGEVTVASGSQPLIQKNSEAPAPKHCKPYPTANDEARATGTHRAGFLVSV